MFYKDWYHSEEINKFRKSALDSAEEIEIKEVVSFLKEKGFKFSNGKIFSPNEESSWDLKEENFIEWNSMIKEDNIFLTLALKSANGRYYLKEKTPDDFLKEKYCKTISLPEKTTYLPVPEWVHAWTDMGDQACGLLVFQSEVKKYVEKFQEQLKLLE